MSQRLTLVPGLLHGFTTRGLGSVAPGRRQGDAVALALGVDHARWTRRQVVQVHGCRAVEARSVGPGDARVEADALISSDRGDLLVIRTADCLAILVVALEAGRPVAVGAIHAGWRGLVAGVVQDAIALLRVGRPSASLVATMGPSIGPCCFEIGPEVASVLGSLSPDVVSPGAGDRSHADLRLLARRLLRGVSVDVDAETEIDAGATPCTRCEPGRFHSHRADGAAAGRMAAFIGMES